MEHKDLWLVIGLVVLLAITVTLSTVSLTDNVIIKQKAGTSSQTTKASTLAETQPLQVVESYMIIGELNIINACKKTLKLEGSH